MALKPKDTVVNLPGSGTAHGGSVITLPNLQPAPPRLHHLGVSGGNDVQLVPSETENTEPSVSSEDYSAQNIHADPETLVPQSSVRFFNPRQEKSQS